MVMAAGEMVGMLEDGAISEDAILSLAMSRERDRLRQVA
jgi:hypothetical protein